MKAADFQQTTRTELDRIAWLSATRPDMKFNSLMHHFNEDALLVSYESLRGNKATGLDGVTKQRYGENLESNIKDLVRRLKQMSYRPSPVRQVLIPKEGKGNATRPLGISNFEDKLFQKRMQELLESIYEPMFYECSYGFRLGRNCHDAIKSVTHYLYYNNVERVIDVDMANFFGTISHELLLDMLKTKIADTRFLRYVVRLFKAGVLADGELRMSDEGVAQGSCCSPVLANIFAHYVIDDWFQETVKGHCSSQVEMFRYADDIIICCGSSKDAERIKDALKKRLAKYELEMNEDKTKMVEFSRRAAQQGKRQGTFDFLGFTFYLGKLRGGRHSVKLMTSGKKLRSKLKRANEWMKMIRNRHPLRVIWKLVCSKLRGHIQYFGVSFNCQRVNKFLHTVKRIIFKWLNRRSQRRSFSWDKFEQYMERFPLPKAKIIHRLF